MYIVICKYEVWKNVWQMSGIFFPSSDFEFNSDLYDQKHVILVFFF